MNERDPAERADEAATADEAGERGGGMQRGLEREYASMGTGEAGAGVGGGGASSSDVEWGEDRAAADEETAGGAMTNEQDFAEPPT